MFTELGREPEPALVVTPAKGRSTCNLLGLARILRLSGGRSVRAVPCTETDQFVERKMAKLHHSGNSQETALKQAAVIGGMLNDTSVVPSRSSTSIF